MHRYIGYTADGTYQVVLAGKIQVGETKKAIGRVAIIYEVAGGYYNRRSGGSSWSTNYLCHLNVNDYRGPTLPPAVLAAEAGSAIKLNGVPLVSYDHVAGDEQVRWRFKSQETILYAHGNSEPEFEAWVDRLYWFALELPVGSYTVEFRDVGRSGSTSLRVEEGKFSVNYALCFYGRTALHEFEDKLEKLVQR